MPVVPQPSEPTPPTPVLRPKARSTGLAVCLALALVGTPGCGSDSAEASGSGGSVPSNGNATSGGSGTTTGGTGGTSFGSSDRLAVKSLGALPLTGCVPSDYYGTITIGNGDFELIIDSGSSTTAVAAESCSACSALSPLYDLDHGTNKSFTANTSYGDASAWDGVVYSDTMVASSGGTALTPPVDVNFVAITDEKDFFSGSICPGKNTSANGYQGILGLGPDTLLEAHTTSWMGAMQSTGKLANNAYAVQICDSGGRMWFGGYDPAFISGEPQYTPMVQTGTVGQYYGVKVADMQFAGKSLGLSSSALGSTVVDTGTSSFILPSTVFEKYATAISANAAFKANFPASAQKSSIIYAGGCAQSAQSLDPNALDAVLPTIGISFPTTDGKSSFKLTLKATESYLFSVQLKTGGFAYCSAMTYTSGVPILGNAMMREHVVVFDRDNEQVGFVPQVPCNSGMPTASFQ